MSAETRCGAFAGRDFNVGVDCEGVERWRRMLRQLEAGPRHGLFTESEHRYCRSFRDPSPHYAARWCAKEALLKALSRFVAVDLRLVEVRNDADGRPGFVLNDQKLAGRDLAIRLSLSHSRETAIAVVMVTVPMGEGVVPTAEREDPEPA